MLELRDFDLLPQAEALLQRLTAGWEGLGVVAGLDARPLIGDPFLPSGHSTLFWMLVRDVLLAGPAMRATIVTRSGEPVRLSKAMVRRVEHLQADSPRAYVECITRAAGQRPDLLVVDRLTRESAPAALRAAVRGLRVLSQLDTVLRGAEVAHLLSDLGCTHALLDGLAWVMAVQRLPTLCASCKVPSPPTPTQLAALRHRFPRLDPASDAAGFHQAPGCAHCGQTGRGGEVTALDICLIDAGTTDPRRQASTLPLQAYVLELARQGCLTVEDALFLDAELLRRACRLLSATEETLTKTHAELERRTTELGVTTRVLQQRTEALVALEGIGQALISSKSLEEVAHRLCRNARDLCGADRAILYYRQSEQIGAEAPESAKPGERATMAEILAVVGWDPALVHQPVEEWLVFASGKVTQDGAAEPFKTSAWPPGVPRQPTDLTAAALSCGLRVPLVVQDKRVGLMIVHTSQKHGFSPGAVALLQTFANQAAVAIQRASLVTALQEKLVQLQEAQAQLVQAERLERELELARQVQQSILPHSFPIAPGLTFSARNEPARQVGGDFYDVFRLDDDSIGIVVGDVSGKGLPAALYMDRVHSLLRAEARSRAAAAPAGEPSRAPLVRLSPRATLTAVHDLLQELGASEMFVTVFFGVLDTRISRLVYARAGHDRPFLLRDGQAHCLGGEGTVLGFPGLDDLFLSDEAVDLMAGDRLVLYTDGLVDAVSKSGSSFGREGLSDLLCCLGCRSSEAICTEAFAAVSAFQEGTVQCDDMTMLVLGVD